MVSTLNNHVCNRVYLNVPYCSSAFLSSGLLFLGPDPPAWNAETRYIHMKLMKKYSDEYFHVEISIYYIYQLVWIPCASSPWAPCRWWSSPAWRRTWGSLSLRNDEHGKNLWWPQECSGPTLASHWATPSLFAWLVQTLQQCLQMYIYICMCMYI